MTKKEQQLNDVAEKLWEAYREAENANNGQQAVNYLDELQQIVPGFRDVESRLEFYKQEGIVPQKTDSAPEFLEHKKSRWGGRLLALFLLIFFGAVFVSVVAFYQWNWTSQPAQVVEEFFKDTTAGNLDRAYSKLHVDLQRAQPFPAFSQTVRSNPQHYQVETIDLPITKRLFQNEQVTVDGEVTARSGTKTPVSFLLVQQGSFWLIKEYRVGAPPPSSPTPAS